MNQLRDISKVLALALVSAMWFAASATAQDVIEFLSGVSAEGKVVRIEKAERKVVFETKLANRKARRVYPYSKIHAVMYKGKRYVLNPRSEQTGESGRRTPAQVEQLIEQTGGTEPDWLAETPLDYPDTLDLKWPMPAPQPWNNRKNMGQYIWDRINPNEGRWRSGVKLMGHLLTLENDAKTENRIMKSLGGMYFRFFQDYPRAAYWWRTAKVKSSDGDGVALAECYYRMGSKRMAMQAIDSRRLKVASIKLLGSMGETKRALRMADSYVSLSKSPRNVKAALLAAGDVCRSNEDYKRAIRYYKRVLEIESENNRDILRDRAEQSIDAIRQFELLDISQVEDGQYDGDALAYEGKLEVRVTVKSGRIEKVQVTQHKEKQYYSAIRDVPAQIVAKQSLKDVDATSRATITAEAIVSATAKALVGDVDGMKPKFR